MAKRKQQPPDEGSPAWMSTFSDLMNLIIAAAHIPQTPADGNANLAAVDALYPRDFRLLDTSNVVGVNTAGLCRSGMSQSHRQSCNQV